MELYAALCISNTDEKQEHGRESIYRGALVKALEVKVPSTLNFFLGLE